MNQCESSNALRPEPKLSVVLVGVVGNLKMGASDKDDSFEGMVKVVWNCRGGIGGGGIVCDEVD